MAELAEILLLAFVTVAYTAGWILLLLGWRDGIPARSTQGSAVLVAGFLAHTLLLSLRYRLAGHLPLLSAFEFVCTFSWLVTGVFLVFALRPRNRPLGVFLVPVTIMLLLYAAMLPKAIEPEIMIFRGLILKVHVATVLIGYAFWSVTFAASVCYLYLERKEGSRAYLWDEMAYKSAFIAFCFHTAAVITGALWANQVWGVLWSWDLKETWSFITWLLFLAYLHARYDREWDGTRAAYLAIAGFGALVFTYVGVDFLLPQLHSVG